MTKFRFGIFGFLQGSVLCASCPSFGDTRSDYVVRVVTATSVQCRARLPRWVRGGLWYAEQSDPRRSLDCLPASRLSRGDFQHTEMTLAQRSYGTRTHAHVSVRTCVCVQRSGLTVRAHTRMYLHTCVCACRGAVLRYAHTCACICAHVCVCAQRCGLSVCAHTRMYLWARVCARRGADLKDCLRFLHLYPVNFPHVIKHSSVSLEWHAVPWLCPPWLTLVFLFCLTQRLFPIFDFWYLLLSLPPAWFWGQGGGIRSFCCITFLLCWFTL